MRLFTAAFAIASGLIVLLGYFFRVDPLVDIRLLLVDWSVIIAGIAVLIGIYNLIAVQMEKIRKRQKGGMYGVVLVLSLIVTFGLGLFLGPEDPFMRFAADAIIVPAEAALMAMLTVTLVYASIRLLRHRVDVPSILFLAVAVIFMFAIMPVPLGLIPGNLDASILGFLDIFSSGGARGLLIGIALGILLTGLRILFGIDRPYGGN